MSNIFYNANQVDAILLESFQLVRVELDALQSAIDALGGGGYTLVSPEPVRLAMTTATHYAVVGDSTRDNSYNDMIAYYTRMLGKAGITMIDNAASGQSGFDWSSNADSPNVNDLIAAIPSDGTGTVVEFSLAINDTSSSGGEAPEVQLAKISGGLDALIAAKPNITLFFVQPVPVAAAARNDSMIAFYDLLARTYNKHLVMLHDVMASVYDDGTGNVFYFDGTHPTATGSIRAANYILSEILPDSLLSVVLLDNDHWQGSSDTVVFSFDQSDIVAGYWGSNGNLTLDADSACFPAFEYTAGQRVVIDHKGSRDDIRLLRDLVGNDGVEVGVLSTPASTNGTEYTYESIVGNEGPFTHIGATININAGTPYVPTSTDKVEVIDVGSAQGPEDLTQAEINIGLILRLQAA